MPLLAPKQVAVPRTKPFGVQTRQPRSAGQLMDRLHQQPMVGDILTGLGAHVRPSKKRQPGT